MKKYQITVNGQTYDVTLEEISEQELNQAHQSESDSSDTQASAPNSSEGIEVTAPMPGTIISLNVQVGTSVKAGDTLCILEAMKMESAVVASADGVVNQIFVDKGTQVEAGTVLMTL
ncbi:biotin/lipoyl-binding protein [Streptococcus chenjunshii]|uniref:Biotin/lipoyl-binding protein n=1 Tax=Streptococcus chenjunshii TaxID=2173853 RepID=A0A372KJJ3_9STRE|nr:biotin/lipoyl-containing protein [Streptococcus chenjunshii]AXQ78316.1 biotin/lipoyl-binding protein [Streptococcus chenjunshii]RFU50030.1 biotin/lipoyl-binding protein [Streptococcus chenjunshii]RFU52413.1 biotin/lipoyl-binding protein [Streptococcus chenjunshii]